MKYKETTWQNTTCLLSWWLWHWTSLLKIFRSPVNLQILFLMWKIIHKYGTFTVQNNGRIFIFIGIKSCVCKYLCNRKANAQNYTYLQHNKYEVGSGEQFDDLVGLIEHFRSYPMTESSGDVLRLLQPVSGTRMRARDLGSKLHEMQVLKDPPRKPVFFFMCLSD